VQRTWLKSIYLYVIGFTALALYFVMKNSEKLNEFLYQTEQVRPDWKFGIFSIIGLIEYSLLIIGISIIVILSTLLLKKKLVSIL